MIRPRAIWRNLTELAPGDRVASTAPRTRRTSTRATLAAAYTLDHLATVRELDLTDARSLGIAWNIRSANLSMRRYRADVQFLVIVSNDETTV